MNVTIIFMVSLALGLAITFIVSYIWAMRDGQFDDLETPAHRILKDDFHKSTISDTHEGT